MSTTDRNSPFVFPKVVLIGLRVAMVDDHGNNLAAGIPVLLFLLADLNPTVNRMGRCK